MKSQSKLRCIISPGLPIQLLDPTSLLQEKDDTLRDRLHIFSVVAEKQNFTQAAQVLFLTQPAVSAAIKALEAEYGLPLFSRAGGRVELTEAGRVLQSYSKQILSLEEQAARDIGLLAGDVAGRLNIGASTTIAQYILPRVLGDFVLNYPNVGFALVSQSSDVMAQLLVEGKVDVAIVEGEVKGTEFNTVPWLNDQLYLNGSAASNSGERKISFEELVKLPLLMREKGSGHYQALERAFKDKGVALADLNIVLELGSSEAVKLAVENGLGYAFLSEWACSKERSLETLKLINVEQFQILRSFSILQTKESENNNLVQRFISFLHKATPRVQISQ